MREQDGQSSRVCDGNLALAWLRGLASHTMPAWWRFAPANAEVPAVVALLPDLVHDCSPTAVVLPDDLALGVPRSAPAPLPRPVPAAGEARAGPPQAFAIDNTWAEPTNEELRYRAYLSIVHGATGLVWYARFTTETWSGNPKGRNQWFLPDSPMWPYFTRLNAEINELAPVFLEGDVQGPVACDNDAIHCQMWELGGVRTLIAVNPRVEAETCRISGLAGAAAQVMFEDRELALEGGVLTDSFAPLAVHVYRLR